MNRPIYLDYQATTPLDNRIVAKMIDCFTKTFGNASSVDHPFGDEARIIVNEARQQIAQLLNASPSEIIFTSGATESINLVLQGILQNKTTRIAVAEVEHKAVLETCQVLEKRGLVEIINLKVNQQGQLDLDHLEKVLKDGVSLLCVMAANNEIGTIYPLETIAKLAQKYETPFFSDASQAAGKIPLDFAGWGLTFLAISAHKFYGPKGVGALVMSQNYGLKPLILGGGHQGGLRSGTLNVPGIVGMGEACRLRYLEMEEDEKRIATLRDRLQSYLQTNIPDLVVNGDLTARLAGNLHLAIPHLPNSALIGRIRHQLAISTGSACASGVEAPSHVLTAIQLPQTLLEGALRISLGKLTTEEEIDRAGIILTTEIKTILGKMTPLVLQ